MKPTHLYEKWFLGCFMFMIIFSDIHETTMIVFLKNNKILMYCSKLRSKSRQKDMKLAKRPSSIGKAPIWTNHTHVKI